MSSVPAIEGGAPVRQSPLPYGKQSISEADIQAVKDVLRSGWLTTGPKIEALENRLASFCSVKDSVVLSSGTAALHTAMFALAIKPGDEVVLPAISFVATANAVLYQGGIPVFADVLPQTLGVDPKSVERCITPRTKAILAVDYAGIPVDYAELRQIAERFNVSLISDACHALGATYQDLPVSAWADISAFSMHPIKPITSGEGGFLTLSDSAMAARARRFRNHGINSTFRDREQKSTHFYDMQDLGYNYRLSDIHAALALSQLDRIDTFTQKRQTIAGIYKDSLAGSKCLEWLQIPNDRQASWHIFPVRLNLDSLKVGRDQIFEALRAEGIGVNVHYRPIYAHSYYQKHMRSEPSCPQADESYTRLLTLPIFPDMTKDDQTDVLVALEKVLSYYER